MGKHVHKPAEEGRRCLQEGFPQKGLRGCSRLCRRLVSHRAIIFLVDLAVLSRWSTRSSTDVRTVSTMYVDGELRQN